MSFEVLGQEYSLEKVASPMTWKVNGAVEKTRTSTGVTPQRPQRCASTNSATRLGVGFIASHPVEGKRKNHRERKIIALFGCRL